MHTASLGAQLNALDALSPEPRAGKETVSLPPFLYHGPRTRPGFHPGEAGSRDKNDALTWSRKQ